MSENEKWSDEECYKNFSEDVCERTHKKQAIFFMNAFWEEYFKDEEELDDKQRNKIHVNTEKLLRKNKLELDDLKPLPNTEKTWLAYKYFVTLEKKNVKSQTCSLDEMPGSHRLLEVMGQPLTVIAWRKEFKKIDQNFDKKMSMVEYLIYKYNENQDKPKEFIYEMMRRPQGTNDALEKAEEELEIVQAEIQKIEDKKKDLVERSKLDGIKGRIAQQELNVLLAQDPLPLRRALLKAEAAVRRAKKMENLNCKGAMYWVERELAEAKFYKPKNNM